jgi:hypothetical protein|tara:strand:+ start:184 stop:474 length:291 start_codon:yes stop_codon:yes gene_type:complete
MGYVLAKIVNVRILRMKEKNVYLVSSVKFILLISLCSFINNQCLPPIEVKVEYNSWKECTTAALEISKQLIIAQEDTFINNNKVATKFMCEEVSKV